MSAHAATQLQRLPDWQSRFDACVRQVIRTPFAWGRNDCALAAAACVLAITGVDLAAALRGYDSETQAARLLAQAGGLEALLDGLLGPAWPTPLLARVGDVGVLPAAAGRCIAVCTGRQWVAPAESGAVSFPLRAADKAWRVG
jgi:hypothetical protein